MTLLELYTEHATALARAAAAREMGEPTRVLEAAAETAEARLLAALRDADALPPWPWLDCEGRPVTVGDRVTEGQYNRLGVVSSMYNNSGEARLWVGGDGWTTHIEPGRCRLVPAAAPVAAGAVDAGTEGA